MISLRKSAVFDGYFEVAPHLVAIKRARGKVNHGCAEKHQMTYLIEIYGRHEETRTPDLYRVKVAL